MEMSGMMIMGLLVYKLCPIVQLFQSYGTDKAVIYCFTHSLGLANSGGGPLLTPACPLSSDSD